jgi:hypothetical protein
MGPGNWAAASRTLAASVTTTPRATGAPAALRISFA